jgi:hypothetical protein
VAGLLTLKLPPLAALRTSLAEKVTPLSGLVCDEAAELDDELELVAADPAPAACACPPIDPVTFPVSATP